MNETADFPLYTLRVSVDLAWGHPDKDRRTMKYVFEAKPPAASVEKDHQPSEATDQNCDAEALDGLFEDTNEKHEESSSD